MQEIKRRKDQCPIELHSQYGLYTIKVRLSIYKYVSEFLQLVVIMHLSAAFSEPLIWNDGIVEQWNVGNKRPKRIISKLP